MNVEEASEAELRAVFGPRADYYVAQWQGTARRASNWAAFWFSGAWLPFRRLYSAALIFYAAIAVESVLEEVVFRSIGYREVPTAVNRAVSLACAIACGVWGNRWYLARVRRVISETRALALPPEEHLKQLSRRGGTRMWHAVAFLFMFVIVAVATFIMLAVIQGE